jgi:NADH-quinone oxidoreductase subunit G
LGRWQSQAGAAQPVGQSRPGWKVLRVLGNQLQLPGFDYLSSEEVLGELRAIYGSEPPMASAVEPYKGSHKAALQTQTAHLIDLPMYEIDALVRRAPSLGRSREGRADAVTY